MSSHTPEKFTPARGEGRIVRADQTTFEAMEGRSHHWHLRPELTPEANMLVLRVQFPPGGGHAFHHHPNMEETLYVLSGRARQWIDREPHDLNAGDSVHIPAGLIHGSFNPGDEDLNLLAILSPADADPPGAVDVCDREPWRSLWAGNHAR